MKNSNLLNRLLSYSHEKQSPQRFRRYAVMLLMLLTLGVGQVLGAVTLYYQKDMPSGNYSASNSASMTQSSVNSYRYSCSVSLQNGSYGFYIKNGNNFYKVSATATTNESVLLYDYGSTNYGNSNHRVTYNTGAAGYFTFTFDASNNKVCVSKRDGLTIKVAWSTASGHDGDWNLGTYTTLTEEGSTGKYSADVDLTAVKHYMFVQTDNTRYWRGSSTLSVNNSTSLYYYGNSNYGGSGDKINFTPDEAGWHRFTWNHLDKTIKLQRLYEITPVAKYTNDGSTYTESTTGGTVTINGNSSATRVIKDATYEIVATPASGYCVEEIKVGDVVAWSQPNDDSRQTAAKTISTYTATADKTVTVKFAKLQNITLYIHDGGVGGLVLQNYQAKVGEHSVLSSNTTLTAANNGWYYHTFVNVTNVSLLNVACANIEPASSANGGQPIGNYLLTQTAYFSAIEAKNTVHSSICDLISVSYTDQEYVKDAAPITLSPTYKLGYSASATYAWSVTTQPVGGAYTLSATNVASPTFSSSVPGTYTLQVQVTSDGCTKSTSFNIEVSGSSSPEITAATFVQNPILTSDHLQVSISYHRIPAEGCYIRLKKKDGGYYNDESNQAWTAISEGSGSLTFTTYITNVLSGVWTVEIWNHAQTESLHSMDVTGSLTVKTGHTITVTAGANGSVSPSTVYAGDGIRSADFTATPNTGYVFNGWTKTAGAGNFTLNNASSATTYVTTASSYGTVRADFVGASHTITPNSAGHGSIISSPAGTARTGETVTITPTPDSGYEFDYIEVNSVSQGSGVTTFTMPGEDVTVTAHFKQGPTLGAVTATPSGQQNYAGSPIDFALSVTSTYLAHPVVVFLVNDGTTTYEVVGAPYGADGSSAAGTIGSDAANTTVHKATFTASAAHNYTVSAKLYEGLLVENFETADYTTWVGVEGGSSSIVSNLSVSANNGSPKVRMLTPNGVDYKTSLTRSTSKWVNGYQYIHTKMYYTAGGELRFKISDTPVELAVAHGTNGQWNKVVFNNSSKANIDFMFPWIVSNTSALYIDDIILSNEASMTEKASQAATASFSINWDYTVTLNNNGATSAGTESVNVTYGSATGITDITVPTKTGYTFGGYYTADAGAGTLQINASGVWQNAAYVADGKWNSGSNQTLYAKWTENMRNVTISAGTGGTVDKTSASVGVATTTTVTATAQPGYRFTGWTATNCSVASTSSASTTLSGNGTTGDATLVANFARTYAYLEGRMTVYNAARNSETHTADSKGGWDENSTRIAMDYDETNHYFYLHTYKTPAELKAQINSNDQWFSIARSNASGSWSGKTTYHPSDNTDLTTTGIGQKKAAQTSTTSYNYKFNSSTTDGYAILYFDEAGVWYELEQSLKYDANGGSGDAPTPTYYLRGTNATAASNPFTARKNYTFAGWNTAADITGTSYAAGASVPMSVDRILYAKWNRSVTLDQQDATTSGSTSVTATWNCSTLPTINNPEKTGYDFGGWYTETAGNGNIIINTSGQLQANKTNWTVDGGKFQRTPSSDASESKPLYAKWTQTVTLNANLANHGSGDNTSATIVYKATAKTSITQCTPATGYHLEGYYTAATDGVKVLNADGSFASSAVTDYITDGKWTKAGATTLYAHYEPNTYDVILNVNGATTGSNQTVVATFDDDMPTTQKTSGDAITAPSKTGYTFGGYWTNAAGTGTQYYTSGLASSHVWDVATNNTTIYAKWTANPYTITLTQSGETGYGSAGTASVTATYDAALPTISSLPTAANGYAFMGYYTDHNGEGTQYYDATGTKLVATYTTADALELFAYFKKAEITELVASPGVIAPGETITITPTIDPTPVEPTIVCWEVQYSNGTPLPSQPTFTPGVGNAVSFPVPSASATYIIQAVLETGSTCGSGTELSRRTTTFQVAGAHDVTVKYMCGDLTIKASEVLGEIRPLTWSEDITAPTITGYTFARWDAGDGVTIKDGSGEDKTTSTSSTIKIKAVYDGTLTAVYTKKKMIFFNNTLGWSDVYVYFYNSDKYWSGDYGSGANKEDKFDGDHKPYYEQEHGHMTQIEGTNIWYFDYEGEGYATRANVAFTEGNQHGYHWFNKTNVVRCSGHVKELQMFVPLTTKSFTKNECDYYNDGYWMNYPENTGYSLLIYNQKAKAGATKLYEIPFEFTEDFTMPMELVVDLEAGQTYGFEIKRADSKYYSNTGTMTANTTNWSMTTNQSSYCGLQTTAAGSYTFNFFYNGEYRIGVTYPVAINDYRIVYTDLATWSQGVHTASWSHPSRVITKNSSATEVKKDTVSFFWSYDSSPAIKYQKCTGTGAGSVSWNAGTAISVSDFSSVLTKVGVYNFIFEQPADGASISLIKVEPYTGNYYIRTDCAGNSKWENFRTLDHQMTYSDYAKEHSGYSHYYAHWVTSGTNVKFCIANDYSQCITDTLVEDYGTVIANINAGGTLESASANIRFMWNQSTNKVSRAYIGGSTYISDRFLVLEGDSKMYNEDGSALSISGLDPNQANLIDVQNFVYERTIQVNTKARAKLTAKYNSNIQYFKGSEGAFAEGTTIELLGGDADGKHTMRIVYDFKTNRLVTAYVPSGTINDDIAINADLMIVREHQGAGQQLLFEGDGALSEVHTVYGVMRFNRWTLNNKEKTGSHDPVGDPKSIYERSLYWISFPFDVKLSDVFGFGTYGVDWIIEYYDGAERATNGYWVDSDGFWKMVMPAQRADFTLEAGKGYVLAIDVDAMKDNNTTFWANNIEQVELFFPSATNVENITQTTAHTIVPEHECTIDRRTDKSVNNINKDRTKADSHWNMIGIPSYANYGATLTSDEAGTHTITWNSNPYTNDLPFLYEWNMTDDSYTVQSGTTYPFKAMHSYMVQYHGDLYWSLASATPTPSPIVARRAYAEKPQNAEFRLELQQNEKMVDQTFVKLSNDENVSTNFAFDEDLCKEYNANKANIYTIVENYLPVAGNTMPMSDQTTVVPVGVKIAADGEYTFAIPEGTEGIGVVLIDNIAGTRTNLGLMDYSVTLEQGQIDNRFLLEISPIVQSPTGIELLNGENGENGVRKVLIDNILYIVKDGIVYDAQGHRVQ